MGRQAEERGRKQSPASGLVHLSSPETGWVSPPYLHLPRSLSVAFDVRPSSGLREAVHGVFIPSLLLLKEEVGLAGHRDRNKMHG